MKKDYWKNMYANQAQTDHQSHVYRTFSCFSNDIHQYSYNEILAQTVTRENSLSLLVIYIKPFNYFIATEYLVHCSRY